MSRAAWFSDATRWDSDDNRLCGFTPHERSERGAGQPLVASFHLGEALGAMNALRCATEVPLSDAQIIRSALRFAARFGIQAASTASRSADNRAQAKRVRRRRYALRYVHSSPVVFQVQPTTPKEPRA